MLYNEEAHAEHSENNGLFGEAEDGLFRFAGAIWQTRAWTHWYAPDMHTLLCYAPDSPLCITHTA